MKRPSTPTLSPGGSVAFETYKQTLSTEEDLRPSTLRNYLLDVRHFMAWSEHTWQEGVEDGTQFAPTLVTTPLLTHYRSYLQTILLLKPTSINRILVSLKRYCSWAVEHELMVRDPGKVVKLIPKGDPIPRHLTDQEENALLAAVSNGESLKDRTMIILLLHTGLRAHELCSLKRHQVHLQKRSGTLDIYGKRNKFREVPLNSTAREALEEYLSTIPEEADSFLFPGATTDKPMAERTLGRVIKRYAERAKVSDLSPHDLRHRFGYRMAESVPLHRLAQIMGHDSLDTTMLYIKGKKSDLQKEVEKIAWK